MGILSILGALGLVAGCSSPGAHNGVTTISVAGPDGAPVNGFYVRHGQRVPFNEALPFTISEKGLSELEVMKTDLAHPLSLAAQHDVSGWHSETVSEAAPGISGVRVEVARGVQAQPVCR